MIVDDKRYVDTKVSFDQLKVGEVCISSVMQRYLLVTNEETVVCLETGNTYRLVEMSRDVFTPVRATLIVK